MAILIIAEKPSVGRSIAKVLGANKPGEGYLCNDSYLVTWAFGHLVALCEPDEIDERYKRWNRAALPILPGEIPLKVLPKTKKQFNLIKKLLHDQRVQRVVCATDSGREGELIFRYIYQMAKCTKPFDRLWISSMTDAAIREGFANLRPGREYDGLYQSAQCRSRADWLVGMNATRAYTLRHRALLSIGRVQTPTLAMLAARRREIEAFVPRDYWTLEADFGDYKGQWFDPERDVDRFDAEAPAKETAKRVRGGMGVVEKVEVKQEKTPPPLLYDLTTLQREMNKLHGFSAKKTLALAQSLYEQRKALTYPRTDSRYVSKDLIPAMRQALAKVRIPDLMTHAQRLAGLDKLPVTGRIVNDARVSDHHAIIPTTAQPRLESFTPDERAVYDAVVRRFVAVFLPPCITERTLVVTRVGGDRFRTRGSRVLDPGYAALYPERKEAQLPPLKVGEERRVLKAAVKKAATKPPVPHTEATLLSAMENAGQQVEDEELKQQLKDSGLGTPATRAAVIERLIAVGYVQRKGRTLLITDKGMALIGILPEMMTSAATTGKWERGLNRISRGEMDPERFMQSIERYVRYIIDQADASQPGSIPPDPPKRKPVRRAAAK